MDNLALLGWTREEIEEIERILSLTQPSDAELNYVISAARCIILH